MSRSVSHIAIVSLFRYIADNHTLIKGFVRMNLEELQGAFRSGVALPVLMLESHEGGYTGNTQHTLTNRTVSFSVLDKPKHRNDYDDQDRILDASEQTGLDIINLLIHYSNDPTHWLYHNLDKDSVSFHKVGPLFSEPEFD